MAEPVTLHGPVVLSFTLCKPMDQIIHSFHILMQRSLRIVLGERHIGQCAGVLHNVATVQISEHHAIFIQSGNRLQTHGVHSQLQSVHVITLARLPVDDDGVVSAGPCGAYVYAAAHKAVRGFIPPVFDVSFRVYGRRQFGLHNPSSSFELQHGGHELESVVLVGLVGPPDSRPAVAHGMFHEGMELFTTYRRRRLLVLYLLRYVHGLILPWTSAVLFQGSR